LCPNFEQYLTGGDCDNITSQHFDGHDIVLGIDLHSFNGTSGYLVEENVAKFCGGSNHEMEKMFEIHETHDFFMTP